MWVKKFKMFREQEEATPVPVNVDPSVPQQAEKVNSDALDYLRKEISDYKANKGKMENIFRDKNNDEDNRMDLEELLRTKIFLNKKFPTERNRFLTKYEELLNLQRTVLMTQKAIEHDITSIADREAKLRDVKTRQNDISNTSEPSTSDNKKIVNELKQQEEILSKELNQLKTNVQKSKASLVKLKQSDIQKASDDFKKFIQSEESRLKGLT
jgi:hypothetical protein